MIELRIEKNFGLYIKKEKTQLEKYNQSYNYAINYVITQYTFYLDNEENKNINKNID